MFTIILCTIAFSLVAIFGILFGRRNKKETEAVYNAAKKAEAKIKEKVKK